jgi:hypothetical protein
MLSKPKSAMAAPQKELETSIQPLKRPTDYYSRTKAYWQSFSLNCATNTTSQLMFAFSGRNGFISMENLWRRLKKPYIKPSHTTVPLSAINQWNSSLTMVVNYDMFSSFCTVCKIYPKLKISPICFYLNR